MMQVSLPSAEEHVVVRKATEVLFYLLRFNNSKICCRCFGPCDAWKEVEEMEKRKIRGLRRCTQRDCMIPLNRDRNGAINIGYNFIRLMKSENPIRMMTDEEVLFHQATLCTQCD